MATALSESTALARATLSPLQVTRPALDALAASDPKLAYSINEMARILSISRSTVYKAIRKKLLTKIKLLGKPVITRASIDDLLAGKGQ